MKEKQQASSENVTGGSDNRLEAVRDLLFGPNDQEYRKEFHEIKKQIESDAQDAQNSIADLREELMGKLSNLEEQMIERFETLEANVEKLASQKTDRKKLANLLIAMAKELESSAKSE